MRDSFSPVLVAASRSRKTDKTARPYGSLPPSIGTMRRHGAGAASSFASCSADPPSIGTMRRHGAGAASSSSTSAAASVVTPESSAGERHGIGRASSCASPSLTSRGTLVSVASEFGRSGGAISRQGCGAEQAALVASASEPSAAVMNRRLRVRIASVSWASREDGSSSRSRRGSSLLLEASLMASRCYRESRSAV